MYSFASYASFLALAAVAVAVPAAQLPQSSGVADSRTVGTPAVSGPGTSVAQHPKVACEDLAALRLRATDMEKATLVGAGAFPDRDGASLELPEHCLVRGVIERRMGVGGTPYGIHFEMRLPTAWNGRFLFQGGGGTNGSVAPALGIVKGPAALTRGFAVITQDAGHSGADASFGADQQARVDMIFRSYDRVTTLGKDLLAAYYGRAAEHSYFMGCSEGGREALLASQRMPTEYDGVVAGDPGLLLGVSLDAMWVGRVLDRISPRTTAGAVDRSRAFSESDLRLAADLILKVCDGKDGLVDGLIENWPACRVSFQPLTCQAGGKTGSCLSAARAQALDALFTGGKDPKGRVLSAGLPYDTGVAEPNWRQWKLGAPPGTVDRWSAVSPFGGLFLTPYEPGFNRVQFDYDRDFPRMQEVGGQYRADGVMYSTFELRGSKLLVYTGASDPVFPATDLVAWYKRLAAVNGGAEATESFARLFVVPGMTHCRGGRALDEFDPLTAVVDWVERAVPPARIVATGKAFPGRSRPLCPFPRQPRYTNTGSIEDAANFECRMP